MKGTTIRCDLLQTYHRNPRRGNVDIIVRSLRKNGQYRPIVVNEGTHTGRPLEVLAGNHTLAAARELGWDEIDVVLVDLDEQGAARVVAADNRTADLGSYDAQVLDELLLSLPDLQGTGYEAIANPNPHNYPDRNIFRLGALKMTLGAEDAQALGDLMDAYGERVGVLTGFVGWLADGGFDAQV